MIQTGKWNKLRILRETMSGLFLDGGVVGEILLPGRYIPRGGFPGPQADVFIYRDSEDRLIATTETPKAVAGEFASFDVVDFKPGVGAFLDWGLAKDLLLPLKNMRIPARPGERVVAFVCLDEATDRIVATTKFDRHLDLSSPPYKEGDRVDLLIESETPLGWGAIIDGRHRGLMYQGETGAQPRIGDRVKGFVRSVRPDGKIDLGLDDAGYQRIAPLSEQIIEKLKSAGGSLPHHDKSTPEEIRAAFGCSKKAFKQALGALYSEKRIRITNGGFELIA
ncbi:MAG: S1-like domain-containing RNA-binding protein [Verrucomicrobiaceae bacterium]